MEILSDNWLGRTPLLYISIFSALFPAFHVIFHSHYLINYLSCPLACKLRESRDYDFLIYSQFPQDVCLTQGQT